MKYLIALVIFLSLGLAQPSEMLEFPIYEKIQTTVPLKEDSDAVIKLELAEGSSDLKVQVSSTTQTLPITYITEGYTARASLLVADFNFDGFNDLALPESEGYGGVNYFYRLYVYTDKGFEALLLPKTESACNPYPDNETSTLETSCKSGPSWYQYHHRFEEGKPYLSLETGMLNMDAISADSIFWLQSEFDASGKKLASSITGYPDEELAPTGTVLWDKLYLFTEPDKTARTKTYLIKGDSVEVLALSDDNTWVTIAYQDSNGQRQTAWVKPLSIEIY